MQKRFDVPHAVSRAALGEAGRRVWDFLTLLAEDRYAEANALREPGSPMLFPGGVVLTDCLQMPARAAGLYRRVEKVFERFDESVTPEGTIVYNFGTLRGEWLDGAPLDGVRYIDRFVVRDGRIVDQKVWNDLCVAAARRTR
jgi:hypothetical protein